LSRRWRTRWDEDGGVGVGHIFYLLVEDLSKVVGEGRASVTNTEYPLLEAVVVVVEDCEGRSQCEEAMGDKVN